MNADGLKELFEPFGAVQVKRMFGGRVGGEVFLKVDAETEKTFSATGSSLFVYNAKGKPLTTSFWRLPSSAYDEPDELRRWAALGLEAARRAAAAKAKPKGPTPAARGKPRP